MTDWIDKILQIGGCFDWITPAIDLIEDFALVATYSDAGSAYNHRNRLRQQGIRAKVEVDYIRNQFHVTAKR